MLGVKLGTITPEGAGGELTIVGRGPLSLLSQTSTVTLVMMPRSTRSSPNT